MHKSIARSGHVAQFQPFAQRGEINRVLADFVTQPQGMDADLPALAGNIIAMAAINQAVRRLAGGF